MSRDPAIETIRVIRHGTALELALASGAPAVVRRRDLGDLGAPLGPADWPDEIALGRRFTAAEVAGDRVLLTFDDGSETDVPAASLLADRDGRPDRSGRGGDAGADRVADLVITGIATLLTADSERDDRAGNPLGVLRDAAVVCRGQRIAWLGPQAELGRSGWNLSRARRIDAGGRLVTPGLVDCHAHPMFAGDRADEFARRARGQGYLEIAAAGGGIKATLEPTRSATVEQHIVLTARRMARALAAGTTTCEAKSGYDLTAAGELRLLEVAWAVDALQPVDLVPTLLGAHVLPPEYADDRDGFVSLVSQQMIPETARRGLATMVDVYCDDGAFTLEETRTLLRAGRDAGLGVRAHVGQFSDLGGAELIAELGGLSADHLEQVSGAGLAALAASDVVAVMLPGACVQVRTPPPPVAALRDAGVALALGSDLNPGTSLGETLPIQMWLATTHYGMTVEEAWLGVTRNAARVIDRRDIGALAPGYRSDLVLWNAEIPAEIPYHYGVDLVHRVIKNGRAVRAQEPTTRSDR